LFPSSFFLLLAAYSRLFFAERCEFPHSLLSHDLSAFLNLQRLGYTGCMHFFLWTFCSRDPLLWTPPPFKLSVLSVSSRNLFSFPWPDPPSFFFRCFFRSLRQGTSPAVTSRLNSRFRESLFPPYLVICLIPARCIRHLPYAFRVPSSLFVDRCVWFPPRLRGRLFSSPVFSSRCDPSLFSLFPSAACWPAPPLSRTSSSPRPVFEGYFDYFFLRSK